MRTYCLLFLLFLFTLPHSAQRHDEQKYRQIKAMETGPWNFSPTWYYYWMHKNYSGADAEWQWRFLNSGWVVKFNENKSNVKRVLPTREKAAAVQLLKVDQVEKERKHFEAVHLEELKRATDRNVDIVYKSYKDDFLRLNKLLGNTFDYIIIESRGKLAPQVTLLGKEMNLVNERIAYIHKTGPGYELENVKREKEYIAAKKQLEQLATQAKFLALQAHMFYKK